MQPAIDSIEPIIFIGALLVLISIVVSRVSARLGVPALLLFLILGMIAGSEGPGGIDFDDPEIARSIGVVALALILFAGGLDTNWQSVRPVLWHSLKLATIGVLLTALLLGWFVSIVTPFSLLEGLLLGSIVSSTDAAAVFAVLRSKNVRLRGNLKPLLELESGSNDPMAVFLTLGFIGLITKSVPSLISLVPMFVLQMLLGALIGYIAGRTMVYIVNNLRLEYEGLYPVLTFALILIFYSGATIIGGNGFLTVYLAGIIMGNNEFIHKRSLIRFHDGIAWLMQISMFLTLGLFVFPSELLPLTGIGLLVSVVLMFLARPAGVFITLIFSSINLREKLLISWVGLRGAVPIILATFPLTAGIEQADMIFNLVFFIVLTSALFQGSSIPIVAKWLRVDAPLEHEEEETPKAEEGKPIIYRLGEIRVPEDSNLVNKRIVEARIPEAVEIVLIGRGNQIITPTGSTIIKPDDVLLILADEDSLKQLMEMLEP